MHFNVLPTRCHDNIMAYGIRSEQQQSLIMEWKWKLNIFCHMMRWSPARCDGATGVCVVQVNRRKGHAAPDRSQVGAVKLMNVVIHVLHSSRCGTFITLTVHVAQECVCVTHHAHTP